jgi:hypothetical protein
MIVELLLGELPTSNRCDPILKFFTDNESSSIIYCFPLLTAFNLTDAKLSTDLSE